MLIVDSEDRDILILRNVEDCLLFIIYYLPNSTG
jgi:hypothetical protein